MYTIPQIINIAKASQWMANQAEANGALYGSPIDPQLGIKLYVIRRDIELVYNLNPNYAGLQETSIYLLGLCNLAAAAFIVSGGGTVIPSQPTGFVYLIPITGADFFDATNYHDPRITNKTDKQLDIFYSGSNGYLDDTQFIQTDLGIQITIPGFDATGLNITDTFKTYIVNP